MRTARLAGSLPLILPALAPDLVAPEAVERLHPLAASLPPIHRAGFECRLAADDSDVDLQQGIFAADGEPAALLRFVRSMRDPGPAWDRVAALGERWADPEDDLHDRIAELWLELDAPADGEHGALPSVFATMTTPDERGSIASEILALLVDGSEAEALQAVLARCERACPPGAWISHLGAMLGRPLVAVRIHVLDLPLGELVPYLEAIGWPGDTDRVLELGRILLDHADQLALCLDVVGDLLPRIGLECFFSQRWGLDPRWPPLLEKLVSLGLSTPDKAQALLRWPGTITPPHAPAPWPDELIAEALRRPADEFGIFERRLSHVKLTWMQGQPVTAKAYFGWGHLWSRARGEQAEPARPPGEQAAAARPEAIERAIAYLLARRNQAGWWRDFFDRGRPPDADRRVTGYASDEWVTAYVAGALATTGLAVARSAASDALALLLGRRAGGDGGWGYHALLPPDADTTTWVLRLADALGAAGGERLDAARAFVASLTGEPGGVATYREEDAGQLARFLLMDGPYTGWCAVHTCVTAAAAALALDPRSIDYLLATQRPDGSWAGHWWDDDEYATARAIEALELDRGHAEAVARATAWAAARVGAAGAVHSRAHGGPSAFATALALEALCAGAGSNPRVIAEAATRVAAAERATSWLLRHERADGSWAPSARLRVPAPAAVDPLASPETTLTYVDDDAVFTTATVLRAMAAAARYESGSA